HVAVQVLSVLDQRRRSRRGKVFAVLHAVAAEGSRAARQADRECSGETRGAASAGARRDGAGARRGRGAGGGGSLESPFRKSGPRYSARGGVEGAESGGAVRRTSRDSKTTRCARSTTTHCVQGRGKAARRTGRRLPERPANERRHEPGDN